MAALVNLPNQRRQFLGNPAKDKKRR
ncbi:MAG: hypothetical protein ACD_75C01124G0001, partial [uncultured bacterium]